MKKKFVRLISAVLSAAMTLTAVPLSAFAEGEAHTHDGESNVITTPLDFREKTADESGDGWSWVYDTKTLTLDGVNIQATTEENMMSVVTVPDGTKIVLNGENTIVQTDTLESDTYVLSAVNNKEVNCDGTMTISGDGVLNAENRSTDSMARSLGGSIILNGGTVNATGTVKTNSLEIHNDGVLNANATTASFEGVAVNVSGGITVDGNGSLTAVGCANESTLNSAILLTSNFGDKISVSENGSITVPEGNAARVGIYYSGNNGDGMDAEISGGKVTAYGAKYGIYKVNLIMSGTGSVYTTGGSYAIGQTVPTIDEDEFVVKGSTESKASESAVTGEVKLNGGYYEIDGADAKTVVIKPDTSPRIILGKQTGIFKTEEYEIIEGIDMTDTKLKGTVYFDITLKNMSDEEFADARGYFGGDEPDLLASIIKTDYGWVCMVCDTEFSTTYDTDNTLTIKCGDIVSNTVQVKSNANRFNKVTQGDNTNRTVFYTNTSQEEKDNYKLVSTYTVDSESISYNWYSTNSAYSADELGAAVSGSNGEFKLADNIPAGNYVLYCDITYSDGDSTETVTEKFTFTYKECAHENGYSDGKCTNCGALCDHSNIDINTGKCNECAHQFVATISTDGSAPTGYDTLADCLDSVTADTGDYVKIYQDIGDTSATATLDTIDVKHNVMIDLNGHKLNNIKLGVNKDVKLALTGTAGSYVTQVYVRKGGSFVIDSDANAGFNTIFVEDSAQLAVSDGAKVTAEQLTVIASVADDGTTTTSVKLATGMKLGGLTYHRQNNSGALKLGNLLDVTRQALRREDNGNYLDLYKEYGSMGYSVALTVVEHTDADHKYGSGTGKCEECGKPCEHGGDINTDTGICSICGAVVSVALYTDKNGSLKYVDTDELDSLLNEYNGSGTIKLFKDYSKPSAQYDLYGELTIDLNGRQFKIRSITPCKSGKLTIKNSGNPVMLGCNVYPTNDASYAGGTLIIDGDVVLDTSIYVYDSSTVILKAGAYQAGLYARDSKTLYDMLGERKAFFKTDGTLFNANVKEISSSETLTIKDHSHTYVDGECGCGYVCPHSDVDINTGKCTECEYQYAAVIVKDGAVASVYEETEMEAAFQAADSGVNTGCTLRVYKNYTGSYTTLSGKFTLWIAEKANVGALTVSGDITVTGSEKSNRIYGDFNVAAGGKLTFDENCGAMGTVSVGAGTFDCYYSIDITLNINDASSDVILHGGTFRKICYNGGGDRANAEILTLLAENRIFMKTYGELVDGSKTLLKDGFATTVGVIRHEDHGYDSTTGKCKICGKRCGHTDVDSKTGVCKTCQHEFVATLTVGDKVTGFDSLSDCLSNTSEDSENYVKIYKNIDDRTTINVNHTVTVDLNGHNLYYIELEVNNDNGAGNLTLTGSEGSYISQVDVCGGRTFKIDSDANINFNAIFVEAGARFEVSYGANVTVNTLVVKESLTLYGSTTTSVRLTTGMRIGTLTYDLDRNSGSGNLLLYSLLGEGKALQYDNSGEYVDIYEKFTSKIIRDSFTVVYHYEHSYDKATGKCVCGYVCPHSDVDSKTGVCSICEYQLTAGISGVGTAKYFDNIDNAFTAALSEENSGCTLTLYKDCELSQNIVIGNATVTVDMNGHSILLAYRIKVNDGGVLYLKNSRENGSIDTEIEVNKGGTLINGTADDSRSAVSVFGVTADAAKRVEIYGGSYEGLTVNNGTSGIALYGGSYELINTNDLTDSTPVSALLAKGYAFATLNSVTHLPESIVDGSAVTLSEGIRNVTVVKHTDADHKYSSGTGKCDCGYVCPHSDVDSKTGVCSTCKYQLTAGISSAGTAKYFDNIDDAFTAALSEENNGCTLTLYKDCELSQNIVIGNATLTVDVNGHSISPEIRGIDVNDGGVLYLKNSGENGSIGLKMAVNKGGTLINGTADDSSSAVSLFAVTADAAECVEFYGGSCTYLTIKNGTSGIALYGGYYDIICGPLTDNTPVNDLLAKGYAFATLNSVTHLPESIVDGSAKTIGDGLTNVMVVAHEHRYNVETGKCPCGVCALAIFTETTQSSETYTFIESETQFKNIAENEADGVLKLTGDVDCIVKGIIINGNKTIDMNGHTLNVSVGTEEISAVAVYGNVTFENSGSSRAVINATGVYSYGMVTVNGDIEFDTFATFEDGDALINAGVFKSIYVQGRSVIEILGSGKALASESGEILNASVQQIYKAGDNIFVKAHPKHTYDDHGNCACGYKCLHDGEGQVNEDSANKVCSECGAKIYAKVTTADGKVKYFDDITEGLRYADKAENKGCVFTLVTTGGLENDITLSSGQFTITAIDDNYINAYTRKINIKGAEITVENCAFNCFVGLYSGSLTYPEGSTSLCINGISVFGGTLNISDGISENFGANKFTISDTATDAKVTIGGGIYSEIKLGQYTFKDILASGTRLISVEYSQETDEIIATNELLYSIVSEQNTLGVDDDKDYRFVKCDHKNEDGSYAFNEGGICKYCNSEFAASVSYTDGGEKTELFGDIYDAFDKANEIGTATVTLQKNITDDITDTIAVTGNVTLELNGKRLSQPGTDVWYSIEVTSGKLTVNGSGLIKRVAVCNGSNAEINGGTFSDFIIKDGGNAVIKGGQFYSLQVSGEGRNVRQLLADGYAYWSLNKTGYWSTIAEREKQDITNVEVKEAPIKSATITAENESPIIYRNGKKASTFAADVTYSGDKTLYITGCLIDGTVISEKTELLNGYCYLLGDQVDKVVAEDGEIQYYCIFTYDGYDYKSNVVTLTVATCQHPVESVKCDDNGCVCGICNRALTASVELSDGTLSYYENWNDAISAAQESEGCTLKLLDYSGVNDGEIFDISKGRFTVDLNKNDGTTTFAFDVKGGDITFTASQEASSSLTGVTVSGEYANVLIDSKATLNYLVVNSGKVSADGANIGAITINGGDTVINDVNADYLSMKADTTGGSGYNVSIVSGTFNIFTCENESNYTLGRAIASGSRVIGLNAIVGSGFKYAEIQSMTKANYLNVIKCDHKDENDSYALDGNLCPYCNEEIAATVSYTTANGGEQTDLFSDIYDAFAKANEAGTATVTLYKDITNSELTQGVTITGNVTLALNGKKLGGTFAFNAPVEVSDGGMFTVGGDGKMRMPIKAYANSKLIINGGEFTSVMVYIDGDAEIGGGVIDALTIIGNAKAKISGGKFYNIEIANGSLESVLADGYAYKKDGGAWLSIAERAESVYSSVNNDNKPVNVEEAPIKSATLSTEINQLYRNSNANPTLKFNLALAHGSNLNDSYVSKRYGINSYVSGDIIYSSLSALVKDAKLSADEIIDKAGNSVAAKIYFVVITDDGYEIKSNTVSIDLVDCDHSQVVDPTADKETSGNITEPTYCEICESKFNAKITKGDDVKYYNNLDEAAKDAQKSENEGCTLYPLYNKNGYGGQLVITEGNFTLKYAVRTAFSRPIIINGKAKLTVTGRCAVTAFENQDAFIVRGGDVTFDGLATGSNVTINGGNVTMAANNINCLTINGGNVSISSGGFAEIVTTVSDKVIADYIDHGFWVQDRGTKEWIDIYSLNKATASSTNGLTVRLCPMQIIKPIDTVYYTNGYYPDGIPSLQISAVPWYSGEVDAKVAYQWIAIDENGYETVIEGATDRKLSLENLTTGRYYCRLTYSNATTAGVSMKSDVVTATITECEHSGGEATCTEKAKCEICGAEYGETKPHSYAHIKAPEYLKSAATCTEKAVYYTSCTECGLSSEGTADEATFEYGNALGHKYGEWVSNGDGTHTRVCANDNKHTETKACHGGKATCTAKAICEDCGKAYGEMAAHTFTAKTVAAKYLKSAATCTAKAVYYTSCADCGLSSKGTKNEATFEYGNALGHKYGKWVSNGNGTHTRVCANDNKHTETKNCHGGKATCTAKAICEDCGKAYGEMAAHTFTAKSTVSRYLKRAATCTEKSEYYVSCAGCGLSSKGTASEAVFTGSALGHSLTEWSVITEVTCTTNGTQERHCTRCDYKQTRTIVAKGHSYGLWNVTKKVGCITDGEQSRECSVCGNKETKTIAATGVHSYGSWKVAKAATCTTTGTKVRSCLECGAKETVILQPTGHKYVESTVKPTYTEKGYTLHKCSECGTSYKSSYTDKLVLASVSSVKLAGRAADALRVSWDRNTSADGYIVEIYKDGAWARAGKIMTDSTTDFRVTGLKASTFYKFRVRAYKMSGNTAVYSDYGTTLTARTNPSVITGAKLAGRAADALRISWDRNTSADGYIVEIYKDGAWSRAVKTTNNSITTYRAEGLKASTVYKLRVRAYKMDGTAAYYGNYSAEVTARTNPSVIKGAKLAGRAADALRISWERNTSADGYIVEVYKDGAWARAGKITTDSTTDFRVTGLKASTVYKLRVRAYKMSGTAAYYGNYSAEVTARTNPSVMTGVKIGGTAKDALRINWSKNTSAQGYIVEMAQNGEWVRVAKITDNSTTTFRKAGLAKNTSYRFRVCAYHMSGSTPLYGTYVSVSGKTAAN